MVETGHRPEAAEVTAKGGHMTATGDFTHGENRSPTARFSTQSSGAAPDAQAVARWIAYRRILARQRYGDRLATLAALLRRNP